MPQDTNKIEAELLAIRCQLGEAQAFDDLVARWHGPLWRYLRKMAERDELTDELAQESWLRILRGIAKLRQPASLVPWMYGIARRVLMDRLREKYSHNETLEGAADGLPAIATDSEEVERREVIADMLDKLDSLAPAQRELLVLYYLEELSVHDVGNVLEIPIGTVKSRLHYARQALKQRLLTEEI